MVFLFSAIECFFSTKIAQLNILVFRRGHEIIANKLHKLYFHFLQTQKDCMVILILGIFHGLVLFQTDTVSGTETRVVFEVVVRSIIYVIDFIFDVLFIVKLVRAILSFFNPDASNSFFQMLILYSDPILLPIRRLLPASAGIDFSPLIAILIIRFVQLSIMPLLFPF